MNFEKLLSFHFYRLQAYCHCPVARPTYIEHSNKHISIKSRHNMAYAQESMLVNISVVLPVLFHFHSKREPLLTVAPLLPPLVISSQSFLSIMVA